MGVLGAGEAGVAAGETGVGAAEGASREGDGLVISTVMTRIGFPEGVTVANSKLVAEIGFSGTGFERRRAPENMSAPAGNVTLKTRAAVMARATELIMTVPRQTLPWWISGTEWLCRRFVV
jgi:hypothetical protein